MLDDRYYDRDGAPSVTVIWDKTPVARIPHLCAHCGGKIEPGTRYQSVGRIVDGKFEAEKTHRWAYQYPSGCPGIGDKDKAELADQYARDKAEIFPEIKA